MKISDLIPGVVYVILPMLTVAAYRRQWTELKLLDQWCDVITVVLMVTYTAITIRILMLCGEITYPTQVERRGDVKVIHFFRYHRETIRKRENKRYFWWLIAAYPIACTVAVFFSLLPRMLGRN